MEPEPGVLKAEEKTRIILRDLAESLHDMAQPLTALQCRLEIGQLFGTAAALEEAVVEALRESERLFKAVAAMREMVRHASEQS
jgi:signal transduction histidine kinase